MKKLLAVLSAAMLFSCGGNNQKSTLLSGSFQNHQGVVAELTYMNEYINNDRVVLGIEPDESGNFAIDIPVFEPVFATLRLGRQQLPLFLSPGAELGISLDALNPSETIVFSGKGANPNDFLHAWQRELETVAGDGVIYERMITANPNAFAAFIDSITHVKTAFLHTWNKDRLLDDDFRNLIELRIRYEGLQKLLEYPAIYMRANQLTEESIPDTYYDFLQTADVFDDSNLTSPSYVNFLMTYLGYFAKRHQIATKEDENPNTHQYRLAGLALENGSRDYIQAVFVSRELNYGKLNEAFALLSTFMKENRSDRSVNALQQAEQAINRLGPGTPAPGFTMMDIEGKQVSLSDFLGKVVYLDFWASWCGPCMREMPHFKELKKRMADQPDLVFLYISIDTDTQAWRNTVERHEISGVHLNTPGRERGVPALYNVKWIPCFYLIGRDGNIVSNRPPKPSDPDIDRILLEALGV